mmetsp:Transcript_101133/g.241057  ORF Transcript_101133/g.241057 Transcript_101133/m.241057 type:complete len:207 (+) Transcript_101133:960-1580(+)
MANILRLCSPTPPSTRRCSSSAVCVTLATKLACSKQSARRTQLRAAASSSCTTCSIRKRSFASSFSLAMDRVAAIEALRLDSWSNDRRIVAISSSNASTMDSRRRSSSWRMPSSPLVAVAISKSSSRVHCSGSATMVEAPTSLASAFTFSMGPISVGRAKKQPRDSLARFRQKAASRAFWRQWAIAFRCRYKRKKDIDLSTRYIMH